MKYFTKWIPVEGPIKTGDKIIHNDAPGILSVEDVRTSNPDETALVVKDDNGLAFSVNIPDCQKVKLFLCSRNIKAGDKIYWTDPEDGVSSQFNTAIEVSENMVFMSEPDASEIEAFPHECIKVIGEISPDAIWVKEGDQFDKDDWALGLMSLLERPKPMMALPFKTQIQHELPSYAKYVARIKCACCNRFA